VSAISELLDEYLAARGLERPSPAGARKVAEEAIELVEVCSAAVEDTKQVAHELADVVLAAAVVAEHYGFTVEDAIRMKIEYDTDRERRDASRTQP
jgi:phosphoribosyl-ATP pyrophosphohydrolase